MFSFLPLLFLLVVSLILSRYLKSLRAAILLAVIITAVALTALTEGLSLFHAFSFYPLMILWLLLIVAAVKVFITGGKVRSWGGVDFKSWLLSEKLFLGMIVFVCAMSALTAALGAPNTWDSMTYHLARVEHWVQNKTVGFYPTNIIRQLYITPWPEYAIAHIRILGGGPSAPNFLQWFSMVGCLIGVSLIAQQLGAGRRGGLMAAAFAALLPMGILQSVSTQTDYVCALWMVLFVFFLIETKRQSFLFNTVAAGLSLGLAFLTKGNSYIFAVPFLVWFMVTHFKQRLSQCLLGVLLIFVCALSLNMGQYMRNTQTFGSPTWTSGATPSGWAARTPGSSRTPPTRAPGWCARA